jgi:hypothetical protein
MTSLMSVLGHSRRFRASPWRSAVPLKTDMKADIADGREVPGTDIVQANAPATTNARVVTLAASVAIQPRTHGIAMRGRCRHDRPGP